MVKKHCLVHWLGLTPYADAWRMQDILAGEIGRGTRPPTLLLLEHPHTFTFGRRGRLEHLLWDEAELARRGVTVHWVDRGGDVTYHGPGQLVGYPLLALPRTAWQNSPPGAPDPPRPSGYDTIGYLRRLERMLITALARLGLKTVQREGLTGVWIPRSSTQAASGLDYAKLAAIGVKVDALGVTRHGFALNVAPDMSCWQGIVACGLKDTAQTCLAEHLHPAPEMPRVIEAVTQAFGETFELALVSSPAPTLQL